MILVNGTKGIGTGFSTDIMCYNPTEIIQYLKNKLTGGQGPQEFIPYYEGFKGTIIKIQGDGTTTPNNTTSPKFLIKGKYEVVGPDKIRITELPIGTWTDDYKIFLENLIEPPAGSKDKDKDKDGAASSAPIVKEYNDMSTDTHVDITVTMAANIIKTYSEKTAEYDCTMLEKVLGLYATQSTTNMNLFDANEKLVKYGNAEEIADSYSVTRLAFYGKRKDALIAALRKELMVLSNRARYITELLEDTIDLRRKTNKQLVELLKERKYDSMDANGDDDKGADEQSSQGQGYKYLLKLPMDSVSEENVKKLLNEKEKKDAELSELSSKTVEQMWLKDLEELEVEYNKFMEATTYSAIGESAAKVGTAKGKKASVKSSVKTK
jgi:DNA topoisomerase-2